MTQLSTEEANKKHKEGGERGGGKWAEQKEEGRDY